MVEHGNHPDLHRLEPEGAGGQIRIGDRLHPEPGTVRGLAVELALLPVEGGARVAILRDAHRMNDDAQSALLKTLEEPPAGTTLILCADDEERLLPTVRSRCARVRLGPVGVRDIERLLAERELADPPTAARLARLVSGRAGLAVAYAAAPEAEAIRGEIGRVLLDLVGATRAVRLRSAKDLLARANSLAAMADPQPVTATPARRGRAGARGAAASADSPAAATVVAEPVAGRADDGGGEVAGAADAEAEPERKASAADRRRALGVLLDAWRGLARDLALAQLGAVRSIRDVGAARGAAGDRGDRAPGRLRGVPRPPRPGRGAARRQRQPRARARRAPRPLAGRGAQRRVRGERPVSDPHRAPAIERLDATVRGRVQGVGFRVWALREAIHLVLDGFVLNEADGSVRVVAEGPRAGLEALVDRLEDGPPGALVERVVARWEPARGLPAGFRIESRGHRGD